LTSHESHKVLTGADILSDLCSNRILDDSFRIAIIGGALSDIDKLKSGNICSRHEVRIYPVAVNASGEVDDECKINNIANFKPHFVFVCLGSPKQELFILKYSKVWDHSNLYFNIGAGGAFDYLIEKRARPPKIISSMGLEWMWRLFTRPDTFMRIVKLIPNLKNL
jgi:N-acetylglucosaminyldiphosphoundecaprenol N-acetyl-beta-D-mannosaminyltransferase